MNDGQLVRTFASSGVRTSSGFATAQILKKFYNAKEVYLWYAAGRRNFLAATFQLYIEATILWLTLINLREDSVHSFLSIA